MSAPKWFKPFAFVALLWNLFGCVAYLSDVRMGPDDVARLSAAQQALYAARPSWAVAATAFAVWFGALGSLGLLLRKRWAQPALLVSLLGVIGQVIHRARQFADVCQADSTALPMRAGCWGSPSSIPPCWRDAPARRDGQADGHGRP